MDRINRKPIAAALVVLAVAGCRSEPAGIESTGGPDFGQSSAAEGVGTLGSGNKADSASSPATTQESGVGTLGSGN